MKKLFLVVFFLVQSHFALAVNVSASDLEGKWLIVKMGSMDVSDMDDVWQFKNGQWTAISSGKALRPDAYTLKGDVIDLGHTKIQILEFSKSMMKTKQHNFVYTLKKQ